MWPTYLARIRSINHLLYSFFLDAELATVPSKVLQEWAAADFPMPDQEFLYKAVDAKGKPLKPIPYKKLDLNLPWERFNLAPRTNNQGHSEIRGGLSEHSETLGIVACLRSAGVTLRRFWIIG